MDIPASGDFTLGNARVHRSLTSGFPAPFDADGFALAKLIVSHGKIVGITSMSPSLHGSDDVDLKGRIVLPCFIDCHTHIDKGHIWDRKSNPDGTFAGALHATDEDREAHWTAQDVARRMDFSLR